MPPTPENQQDRPPGCMGRIAIAVVALGRLASRLRPLGKRKLGR